MQNNYFSKQRFEAIHARAKFLEEIIAKPYSYLNEKPLLEALKTQVGFCSYQNEELGFYKCSLNSIKRWANSFFPGRFKHLDSLRSQAFSAVSNIKIQTTPPKKSTRSGLAYRLKDLENDNLILQEELLRVTSMLRLSMAQSVAYAEMSGNERIVSLCNKERAELKKKYLSCLVLTGPSDFNE